MQGVMLYYELAEPIVTEIEEEFVNFDYYVEDFGTEEAVSSVASTPFNADIVYQFNAVDRIRDNDRKIDTLYKNKLLNAKNIGNEECSLYIQDGEFQSGYLYAGGTQLIVNDHCYGGASASIYAPTYTGQDGQVIVGQEVEYDAECFSVHPVWKNPNDLNLTKLGTVSSGNSNTPVYLNNGVPTECSGVATKNDISSVNDVIAALTKRIEDLEKQLTIKTV
jgi:hypothetical protein